MDPLPSDPVLDMLFEPLQGDDDEMRSVAIESAASVGGEELTRWCVARMKGANANGRARSQRRTAGTQNHSAATSSICTSASMNQ